MTQLPALKDLEEYAVIGMKSGIVPPNTTKEQAIAIIGVGYELGLKPFQSLRSMSFIRGRLTLSANVQLFLAKQQGLVIVDIKQEKTQCTVSMSIMKEGGSKEFTYTLEDAKRAGLIDKENWQKYPEDMLYWACIKKGIKRMVGDMSFGILTPDEAQSLPEATYEIPGDAPMENVEQTDKDWEELENQIAGKISDAKPKQPQPQSYEKLSQDPKWRQLETLVASFTQLSDDDSPKKGFDNIGIRQGFWGLAKGHMGYNEEMVHTIAQEIAPLFVNPNGTLSMKNFTKPQIDDVMRLLYRYKVKEATEA